SSTSSPADPGPGAAVRTRVRTAGAPVAHCLRMEGLSPVVQDLRGDGPDAVPAPRVDEPRSITGLPKAHLHLHFTGSMRPQTLKDLAEKHGIRLPESLREHHLLRLTPDERGWFRFQRLYDAARACVRDADDMRRIVLEAAEDDAAEG